jgi:hypothetical protein
MKRPALRGRADNSAGCTRHKMAPGISAGYSKPCLEQITGHCSPRRLGSPYSLCAPFPTPRPRALSQLLLLRGVISHCSLAQFLSEGRNVERFAEEGRDVIVPQSNLYITPTSSPSGWAGLAGLAVLLNPRCGTGSQNTLRCKSRMSACR